MKDLKTGFYGTKVQMKQVLKNKMGFQKCGAAGRIVVWHPEAFDLREESDVIKMAQWAKEVWLHLHEALDSFDR